MAGNRSECEVDQNHLRITTSNLDIWGRAFDDTKRSRDFLLDEWHAFRMTMPEEKIKKRQWLSKSKNGPSANSKVKDLEVTSLTDLQNTVRGCEDAWKNQDTVLGQKVCPSIHCRYTLSSVYLLTT